MAARSQHHSPQLSIWTELHPVQREASLSLAFVTGPVWLRWRSVRQEIEGQLRAFDLLPADGTLRCAGTVAGAESCTAVASAAG